MMNDEWRHAEIWKLAKRIAPVVMQGQLMSSQSFNDQSVLHFSLVMATAMVDAEEASIGKRMPPLSHYLDKYRTDGPKEGDGR